MMGTVLKLCAWKIIAQVIFFINKPQQVKMTDKQ